MPSQSRRQNDAFVHEVRSALTVAKVHVQMLTRRQWGLEPAERDHLIARLTIVDEAMNRASRHIAIFIENAYHDDDDELEGAGSHP